MCGRPDDAVIWPDETTAEAAPPGRAPHAVRRGRHVNHADQDLAGRDKSDGLAARSGADDVHAS